MLRLALLLGLVACAASKSDYSYSCSTTVCNGRTGCQCPSTSPPGSLQPQDVPQFVLITNDDGVNADSLTTIKQILASFTNRNGCPIPATWFATGKNTQPQLVQQLYLAGHEIASHTFNHLGDPSPQEILSGREWLSNQTGIPLGRINGFRTPFLVHSPRVRQTLLDNGFLYDSSITETIGRPTSPNAAHRTWPYTFDEGIAQHCNTGTCQADESYPGLWEIPLWTVHWQNLSGISPFDPNGDVFAHYKRELDWRYSGNRAPLGVYLHAGRESTPERIMGLHQFIQYALSLEHVWFSTLQQLIDWMRNPVPASQVAITCEPPMDVDPAMLSEPPNDRCPTFMPAAGCVYGTWNAANCVCECLGEGTPGGYCRDPQGFCTVPC